MNTKRAPRPTIEVTAEIIEASTKRNSSHCMIAEAVRAIVPDAQHISVDLQTIRWSDPTRRLRYTFLTPRVAQVALIDFDQGKLPEEFSFRLRGGQVTAMAPRKEHAPKADSEKENTSPDGGSIEAKPKRSRTPNLGRAHLAQASSNGGRGGVAEVVGGKPPPVMTRFARRREYGLRALDRDR